MDPTRAKTETSKQIKLKALRRIHCRVQTGIFFCNIHISTGKYTAKGQNASAPKTPSTSLKYGNSIDTPVIITTYIVLRHNLIGFSLTVTPRDNGSLKP